MQVQQIPRPPRPPRPLAPRSVASVALEAWLTTHGIPQIDVAAQLGVSRALMSAYVRGVRVPKLGAATMLQKLSKGRVSLTDWRTPAQEGLIAPTGEPAPLGGEDGDRSAPSGEAHEAQVRVMLATLEARTKPRKLPPVKRTRRSTTRHTSR